MFLITREWRTVPAQILFGDTHGNRASRGSGAKVFSGTKEFFSAAEDGVAFNRL